MSDEIPTFTMGGMGGSLPQRLTVEDGHGRPGENAATLAHLAAVVAKLTDEQVVVIHRALMPILSESVYAKIHRLERQLAERRAASGWVRCSDRKPEPGTRVLAWWPSGRFAHVRFDADGDWDDHGELRRPPSHWMPLPTPPKEPK